MYKKYLKRGFDLLASLLLFVITLPIVIITCFLTIVFDGFSSPIFTQNRIGKDEKIFKIYKIRTMARDKNGVNIVTKLGKILRATSIDELPQLVNIIKGEMSFIGPRPWIAEYSKYFTKQDRRRSEVLPGLSGWAQVQGRNDITVKEKLKADTWYVDHISFKTDFTILTKTIGLVFKKTGASISEKGIQDELQELKKNYTQSLVTQIDESEAASEKVV
ncbi:MAG: sugar transferase [Clostridia bacterium]|nr:sugar transferase [Clostridia bacterium]